MGVIKKNFSVRDDPTDKAVNCLQSVNGCFKDDLAGMMRRVMQDISSVTTTTF